MNIQISNSSGKPIYEQIQYQFRAMILDGTMKPYEVLPSIRLLAKELRISVITTKRAYEELEREGYIVTQPGKGSYVAGNDQSFLKEKEVARIEEHLKAAVECAKAAAIDLPELKDILAILYK